MASNFDAVQRALRSQMENDEHLGGGFQIFNPELLAPARSTPSLFFESAFSSGTKELVGGLPAPHIEKFRAEKPVAGFFSHLVGSAPFFALPAIGPVARGLGALPLIGKALTKASALDKAGSIFAGGFLKETALFAPLEAGRLAGSLVNPDEGSFERTLKATGAELLGIGVLGGGFKKLGSLKGATTTESQIFVGEEQLAREARVSSFLGDGVLDRNAPEQIKFIALKEQKAQLPPESPVMQDIDALLETFSINIKREIPAIDLNGKRTHVQAVEAGKSSKRIETLFRNTAKGAGSKISGDVSPHRLVENTGKITDGLDSGEIGAFQNLWNTITPEGWEGFTAFPRVLKLSGKKGKSGQTKGQQQLKTILDKDFRRIDENGWIVKENAEGLTIGIRRVRGPRDPSGRFSPFTHFIFKTNEPGKWFPKSEGLYEANANLFSRGLNWRRAADVPDETIPQLVMFEKLLDRLDPALAGLHGGTTASGKAIGTDAATSRLGAAFDEVVPEGVKLFRQELSRNLSGIGDKARGVIGPSRVQGIKNPRLTGAIQAITRFYEMVNARSVDQTLGPLKKSFTGTNRPVTAIFKTAADTTRKRRTGGSEALFDQHLANDPQALADMNLIRIGKLTSAEAKVEGVHPEALALAQKLEALDEKQLLEFTNQALALGTELSLIPQKGHFGVSATWVGPFRVKLTDSTTSDTVGFGSGFSPKQALEDADRLIASVNENLGANTLTTNRFVHHSGNIGKADNVLPPELAELLDLKGVATDLGSRSADLFGFATQIKLGNPLVDQIFKVRREMFRADPKRFAKDTGKLGARGTRGTPFTLQELKTAHTANVVESNRFLAREAVTVRMGEQLAKLKIEDPVGTTRFNRIFNSLNGVQGPTAKAIDTFTDGILADHLGPGFAMNAVRSVNEAMFMLTLGAWDMGFAALNAITPIQTAIPEVANLLSTPIATLQKYYSHGLIQVPDGGFRSVSFLDTARFAKEAVRIAFRPNADDIKAIGLAMEEGIIGRQFVETIHGGMRSITEGQGGIWRNMQRWSEAPVVATEEASRLYSYVLGRQVGKDFFLMEEKAAHEFARQFVNRTMFGYSAADRPRVLTGALGAGWGLFKNWTMNYTANLVGYSAQAARGNWNPLLWSMAGTAGVGGITAVPFAGMAESASNLFSDKSTNDFIYDLVGNGPEEDGRPIAADMMAHGFPSLMGFTLRSRASAPSSHLATDLTMFSNIAILDRAVALGKGLGGFVDEVSRGNNPFNNPDVGRKLIQAFAPRTLQRAMTSFGEKGVISLNTGNSLVPALSTVSASLASVGLTPLEVSNAFEVQQKSFEDIKAKRETIQRFGSLWADAELEGDFQRLNRLTREIIADDAVNIDSVMHSANARKEKQTRPFLERQHQDYVTRQRMRARGL